MYILSFYTINALKTQKNGRLLYVLFAVHCHVPFRCAFGTAEKHTLYIICTHTKKHTHILVTAPSPHTDIALYDGTKKTPQPFGRAWALLLTILIIFHRQSLALYMHFLRVLRRYLQAGLCSDSRYMIFRLLRLGARRFYCTR